MIAAEHISAGHSARKVLSFAGLSPGCYYHAPATAENPKKRGARPSTSTTCLAGGEVCNSVVVGAIRTLLSLEFVDYGYFKVYHYLKRSYLINHKKVYRLMDLNKLLNAPVSFRSGNKQWAKVLVPVPGTAFSYWEFDIKFMYVSGTGRYAPLLSVIDVKSRWPLGHLCQWSIKKEDVKALLDALIETYVVPEKTTVRCDNGSQFESGLVREYLKEKEVAQEFTKPATPEQNAHIESYHSSLERAICRKYEFGTYDELAGKMDQWAMFYNYDRIHSGAGYKSPYEARLEEGTDVDKLFTKQTTKNDRILIPLGKKETGNAGAQPDRDSATRPE